MPLMGSRMEACRFAAVQSGAGAAEWSGAAVASNANANVNDSCANATIVCCNAACNGRSSRQERTKCPFSKGFKPNCFCFHKR